MKGANVTREIFDHAQSELLQISHPAAQLFPLLPLPDFQAFIADIEARGQLEPIALDQNGLIVDGRNRWLAATLLGRSPITETREFADADAMHFVLSMNIHRRHLSTSERAMLAARVIELSKKPGNFPVTQEVAAQAANVDVRSVRDAQRLVRDAPELAAHVEAQSLTLNGATQLAKVDVPERQTVLQTLDTGARKENKAKLREARTSDAKKVAKASVVLPSVYASLCEELDLLQRNLETHPLGPEQVELLRVSLINAINKLPRHLAS